MKSLVYCVARWRCRVCHRSRPYAANHPAQQHRFSYYHAITTINSKYYFTGQWPVYIWYSVQKCAFYHIATTSTNYVTWQCACLQVILCIKKALVILSLYEYKLCHMAMACVQMVLRLKQHFSYSHPILTGILSIILQGCHMVMTCFKTVPVFPEPYTTPGRT